MGAFPSAANQEKKRRRQKRRRALAPEVRADFDRRVLNKEDVSRLANEFGIEPWYAERRAKRVRVRAENAARSGALSSPQLAFAEPPDDMTPIEYAASLLGERVRRLASGYFVLDGITVGPKEITRAANRILVEGGQKPIPYPGLLPLHG